MTVRAELTQEERDLISKYKAGDEVLGGLSEFTDQKYGTPKVLWIRNLIAGETLECTDVVSLLKAEDEIKEMCKNFKTLLIVMASFGGEEIIEF